VYATNKDLGSISKVYQRLTAVAVKHPVADNMGGSYMTMFSKSGIIFGIINIIGEDAVVCSFAEIEEGPWAQVLVHVF
jgi:hypothetical protein